MRFGVREICDVVFKPLTSVDIGNQHFDAMQPVLYLDTAKTSTLEGASTTVYAQGGKGNPRLIGWDGEKTLTFTVEDALMSPVSFAMLSGAGIVKGIGEKDAASGRYNNENDEQKIYVHKTYDLVVEGAPNAFYAKLPQEVRDGATLIATKEAPIYATILDSAGAQKYFLSSIGEEEIFTDNSLKNKVAVGARGIIEVAADAPLFFKLTSLGAAPEQSTNYTDSPVEVFKAGDAVRIDCYAVYGQGAQELQIDAEHFAGYYYIEASTLFRDESTGRDFPAEFIIPRGKIQSNFTFSMANSGDPSTFTFTIDAFPAYTKFNKGKKVMAALQILDPEADKHNYADKNIIGHENRDNDEQAYDDEYAGSIFDQITESSEASAEDQAAADAVSEMPVTTDSEKLAALQAYNKLTETQKKLVSKEVRTAIGELTPEEEAEDAAEAAEAAINAFLEDAEDLPENPTLAQVTAMLRRYAEFTDEEEAQILGELSAEAKQKLGLA